MAKKTSDARPQLHLYLEGLARGQLRGYHPGAWEEAHHSYSNPRWGVEQPESSPNKGCHFHDSTKQLSVPNAFSRITMCSPSSSSGRSSSLSSLLVSSLPQGLGTGMNHLERAFLEACLGRELLVTFPPSIKQHLMELLG